MIQVAFNQANHSDSFSVAAPPSLQSCACWLRYTAQLIYAKLRAEIAGGFTMRLGIVLIMIFMADGLALAQESRLPIIDMHFHTVAVDSQGPPPLGLCSPFREIPSSVSAESYPDQWLSLLKNPPCDDPVWSPTSDRELMAASLAMLDEYNIFGVASGPEHLVRAYEDAAPDRIIQALLLGGSAVAEPQSIDSLRILHDEGRLEVIGELTTQYAGISPDDERLEPLWALAEELDLPVGIHIGTGPPGVAYLGASGYRARLHSALTLEEVLIRHPSLRIYISHAGWPMLEDLLALLWAHPQVYMDVAAINWALPTPEFHSYLQRIVEAGFGSRVMYGSDQMVWPGMIPKSIAAVRDAPFLDEAQKRDILYNNAARFLRLSEEEIATHHGK
ncbi:amidohydrolase family protein [Kineobactrum salinum]|uniref:Amidohydrolase n=1 Tax=Kineobactrum salinum TaxID=2708301 RepID=A0A6C0U7K0_9GAMM|nr:amidohydrolase family protein [Kineobactrum salinum]QIB67309.1 amidohydrolase [Kineobactrum salinum]